MNRILTLFVLALCFASAALAQDAKTQAEVSKTQEMLKKAAENGRPLQVAVNGNVSAAAVLIPQVDARRIFGKEIADHYAVIEVNVGNKSPDAALIIHDIFIDYSRWALSGTTDQPEATVEGLGRDPLSPFQASTNPSRVASEEYRVVRGQLLDAQPSTKRNRIIKWLSLAGTVMAAYTFSLNERGIIQGITQYNGVVMPAVGATFPDAVIPQLNRVSDFGFQTNKVIPKQGGEVIVCFFPIERFLTPGFRTLFLKSPALFFAPLQMLVDDTAKGDMNTALGEDLGLTPADLGTSPGDVQEVLRKSLPCYLRIVRGPSFNRAASDNTPREQVNQQMDNLCLGVFGLRREDENNPAAKIIRMTDTEASSRAGVQSAGMLLGRFLALDYLSQASLNNVKVTIDGVMTVDISSIAAKIDEVTFDDADGCGPDKECFWTVPAGGSVVRTGTIKGSYLTGGSVLIDQAADLHIEDVKPIAEGSSDQALRFSFKLTQNVTSGTTLSFKVTKPRPGLTTTLDSQPWMYVVGFLPGTPTIDKVEFDAEKGTLTLTNLGPAFKATDPLTVSLLTPGPNETLVSQGLKQRVENGKIVVDLPQSRAPGCWTAVVKNAGRRVKTPNDGVFLVPAPPPTLVSAAVQAGAVVLTGTNFIDTGDCGKELRFQMVEQDDGTAGKIIDLLKVKAGTTPSATDRSFELPDEAKPGTKWVVQVRRGDDPAADAAKRDLTIPPTP